MKRKYLILFFILVLSALLLAACKEDDLKNVNVTYVVGNGMESVTHTVTEDDFSSPNVPKSEGYVFLGWCTDEECTDYFDFSSFPEGDLTLFASWTLDYDSVADKLASSALKFNIMIKSSHYESNSLFPSTSSQGSGVIYKEKEGYYYAITNAHVLVKSDEYVYNTYTVYDAFGNSYSAERVASDPNFDLGVLRFKKSEELSVVEIDERIPWKNETLVSVGSPKGIFNSVTYGNVTNYKALDSSKSELINNSVDFPVIWHTAYANHGSSGGAILDSELHLVGINFAVATDMSGDFLYCFAVPCKKIIEFLELNELK